MQAAMAIFRVEKGFCAGTGGAGAPGAPAGTFGGYPAATPVAGPLLSSEARMVLFKLGPPGGAAGICKRWPQDGQFFFLPASLAGDSRGFLQLGQLYLMGGAGLLSSLAIIVLLRLGAVATGAGGGAAGTCKRCPQAGQGFFVPASLASASKGALQRGQLYLMGGAISPIMVLA